MHRDTVKKMKKINVLALLPYPIDGSSSRYRIYQFIKPFLEFNIRVSVHSIMTPNVYERKIRGQKLGLLEYFSLFRQMLLRIILVLLSRTDVIILSREFMPSGRAWAHWLFSKLVRVPIIYDFDDAVFTTFPIDDLLRVSIAIIPGNQFLADYAKQINPKARVLVIPTVVDTNYYQPQPNLHSSSPVVVGWIGTESTYNRYLAPKLDFLVVVAKRFKAVVHVIGPVTIRDDVTCKGALFLEWSLSTEREHMAAFHVGVMPLFDDRYTKGKCAFKIIEYGAFGIPSVASSVGANLDVVVQGETGFLVDSDLEWQDALKKLLTNPELRATMGAKARDRIVSRYSLDSQVSIWADLIRTVVQDNNKSL